MRVICSFEETTLSNEEGYDVDGVIATCSRCQHSTESYGTSRASRKRCLVMLREECANNEANFYIDEDDV